MGFYYLSFLLSEHTQVPRVQISKGLLYALMWLDFTKVICKESRRQSIIESQKVAGHTNFDCGCNWNRLENLLPHVL